MNEIKSRIYSTEARERHDDIFAKRTFNEWLDIEGIDDFSRKLGGKLLLNKLVIPNSKKQFIIFYK
jgi:hypothetical protein